MSRRPSAPWLDTLHVAALPFPSPQGTQAALHHMLDALAGSKRQAELLTYAHGAKGPECAFVVHRVADFPRLRSLRSGPSLRKLALDLRLAAALRVLLRGQRRKVVVAHHVEAAAAALLARARPFVFVAHTDLELELPSYLPAALSSTSRLLGCHTDRVLMRSAAVVAAISPLLAGQLGERHGVDAMLLPLPWSVGAAASDQHRREARRALRCGLDDAVLLYAGNLDRYQGWELLIDSLSTIVRSRPKTLLVVATESDPGRLRREAVKAGLGARLRVASLAGEAARRAVHSAADLALVPRGVPGGLPVKLLDSLARALPTVSVHRAAAGLPLSEIVWVSPDDDARALAATVVQALSSPVRCREMAARGQDYIRRQHSPQRFVAAMDAVIARACARSRA